MINFHSLIAKTGSKDGARATFEEMLAQLIRLSQPECEELKLTQVIGGSMSS